MPGFLQTKENGIDPAGFTKNSDQTLLREARDIDAKQGDTRVGASR